MLIPPAQFIGLIRLLLVPQSFLALFPSPTSPMQVWRNSEIVTLAGHQRFHIARYILKVQTKMKVNFQHHT